MNQKIDPRELRVGDLISPPYALGSSAWIVLSHPVPRWGEFGDRSTMLLDDVEPKWVFVMCLGNDNKVIPTKISIKYHVVVLLHRLS